MDNHQKALSKSAAIIQNALLQQNVACEVVELSSSTRTAQDAALALQCKVGQIVKSLLFRAEKTNQAILILASGANRVNESTITKLMGETIVKADAEFTRERTGFAIGGVPPIGHKGVMDQIFIDEDLLQFEIVWAAAGTPHAVFSIQPSTLEKLSKGKIITIK